MQLGYKIWLEKEGKVFGEGPYNLLKEIQATGSLSQAAKKMKMSYSQAHTLMKRIAKKLGYPIIISKAGGYSGGETYLTEEGLELMKKYRIFADECDAVLKEVFKKHFS